MMRFQNEKPQPGELVVLTEAPLSLLSDLPTEDQRAISDIVGKPVLLDAYNDDGKAELEFTDSSGGIHFICVNPNIIRAYK
jgi:hypothetical protein